MSITQTAATLEAYEIKIQELKSVEDALIRDLRKVDAAIALSNFVTYIAGLLAGVTSFFSLLVLSEESKKDHGDIAFALFLLVVFALPAVIWFIVRFNKRNNRIADRKTIMRKMQIAAKESQSMKLKKSAIVSGVVAVTNMEVSAATIADKAVESPVDSSMSEKTCPMCAETVKAAAKICKHCKHAF